MKRNSVVVKLFVVTAAMIFVVFTLVMLAEGLFFERFYRASKIDQLESSVVQFGHEYAATPAGGIDESRLLGHFMNHHDASISIVNHQFERVSVDPYFIQLLQDSRVITIRLSSDGTMMKDIPSGLRTGDSLVVDGFFMDEEDTIMQLVKVQQPESELGEGLMRVKGKITDLLLPEQRSFNPFYQDNLIQSSLSDWMQVVDQNEQRLANGLPVKMEWTDNWSGIQYAVVMLSLPGGEAGDRYAIAMTSLQPVGEAVSILKRYFIYLTPVILVLVILLSLAFSRLVSSPLVKLSRLATRMAQLDFTIQPTVHSKDEFGDLSRSMNTLSENLNTALQQLTESNRELQEEIDKKQRLEQLRKELIGNISHELKTPLGIVKGFAEGLQDDVAADKRERYLQLIVNETDRMNALIMDMLELSKYEAKAVRLQFTELSLAKLIQNVADSFSYQLESKQLQVTIQEAGELMVKADARRMEQVVQNLLSNAIRYGSDHSIIRIDIQRLSPGKIITHMENEGPPLAEDDFERIWEQFYRAERSRDRRSGGTGLGLAIVKNILELHGSEFGARNTNRGVSFYFTLEEAETRK
ncbi:sensor histidine kinase [Paenibacillus paridis]|uniref:sensor histidine kinase n=1 Tax=Paenibacillus paridis TaxID=2583376 RepID=UPI0011214E65|nr:HAMP domain-containing sensor histidine kinase [Paenibacillus paridis]